MIRYLKFVAYDFGGVKTEVLLDRDRIVAIERNNDGGSVIIKGDIVYTVTCATAIRLANDLMDEKNDGGTE